MRYEVHFIDGKVGRVQNVSPLMLSLDAEQVVEDSITANVRQYLASQDIETVVNWGAGAGVGRKVYPGHISVGFQIVAYFNLVVDRGGPDET